MERFTRRIRRMGKVERVLTIGVLLLLVAAWSSLGWFTVQSSAMGKQRAGNLAALGYTGGSKSGGGPRLPLSTTVSLSREPAVRGRSGAGTMTVYIIGAVRVPGLYSLPLDARVADALKRAGGPTRGADLAAINLAAVVEDGMEVVVPSQSDTVSAAQGTSIVGAVGTGTTGGAISTGIDYTENSPSSRHKTHRKRKLSQGEKINLNTATQLLLMELPGVGNKRATAILQYRHAHGLFLSLSDLGRVPGVGPHLLSRIEPFLTL